MPTGFRRKRRARTRDSGPWEATLAIAGSLVASGETLRRTRRRRRDARRGYVVPLDIAVDSEEYLRAVEAVTGAPVAPGNRIETLVNGDRIFPALLDAIGSAERTVNLLTYIYWAGEIAQDVADALEERSRAGVECNVLLDAIGASRIDKGLIGRMQEAGVRTEFFRPVRHIALGRVNHRTHRKVLVVDGRIGMTGGVGIADQWTGDAQDPEHWRDTHFRVEGPIVNGLHAAFAENWLETTGEYLAGDRWLPPVPPFEDGVPMQVVRSTAGHGATDVETLFFLALRSARTSIRLTSAYFVPRPAFLEELARAARRGVSTQVLVPGPHADKRLVRAAGCTSYRPLLEAGVRIFEYQPTMMHAKALVVDGAWSAVGSVNYDARSFELNDEVVLCVQGSDFARGLDEVFAQDLSRSREIDLEEWCRRPAIHRVEETVSRILKGQA
jgi:cardiolipin synthase